MVVLYEPLLTPSWQDGHTALILAAKGGHLKVVELLIEKGADVERTNNVSCDMLSVFSLHPC